MSATAASLREQERIIEALDFDTVSAVAVAKGALAELDQRREYAAYCAALYAIEAIVDGEPVEKIMEAAGFLDNDAPARDEDDDYDDMLGMRSLFGLSARRHYDPKRAFLAWLQQGLAELVNGTYRDKVSP